MFEGLVGYKDQTKVVPLLATSWSTPDDNTWVFNLRHNVKFNTGRTMTAADVKYSLDYAVANQNANNGYSAFYFVANKIKQVTVDNAYQVTITTTSPDAVLLNQLGLIGIVDSKAKLGDFNAGTGPYVVKPGTTPTASTIDLVAANNYWGGHIYTREVKINLYTDPNKLITDMANGKIDLAGPLTDSQLGKLKSYNTINVGYQGVQYMTLNLNRLGSPFQTLAARQAVAYALNIPAILKASGYQGQQASQIVPLILPGHNPTIQNTPYNPSKAKQLLATVVNANSPITFAYPAGLGSEGSEITNELNAVGFNVKSTQVADFGTFITDANAGQFDLFTAGDTSATVDGLDILTDLLANNKNYDNPQIDSLLTAAGDTLNVSDRINDMQEIATIVANVKPDIPLYIQNQVFALTKPYVITPSLPDLESSAYFWQVYQK
jgi:peptide/nickel transport system substrate-binding protein